MPLATLVVPQTKYYVRNSVMIHEKNSQLSRTLAPAEYIASRSLRSCHTRLRESVSRLPEAQRRVQ